MSNKKTQRNHYTSVAKRHPVLRNASVIILGFLIFIAVIVCYTVATQASDVGLPSPTHANVEAMEARLNQPTFPEATVFDSALVSEIQTKLRALGYNDVEINGLFDSATGMAIKDFQRKSGITVDGIIGPVTANLLGINLGNTEKLYFNVDLEKLADISDSNYLIYISLRSKTLTVFRRTKDSWKSVDTVPCAIGKDESPTAIGIFQILNNNGERVVHGDYTYFYPSFFYETKAIHSVSYDSDSDYWGTDVLGEKVTNGCVYVEPETARWIQTNCPIGTYIAIDDRTYNP